jgi:hypothetical protein
MRGWKIGVLVAVAVGTGYVLGVAEGELPFTKSDIASAQKLIAMDFTDAEQDSMLPDLVDQRKGYEDLRAVSIPNDVPPALVFNPIPGQYLHASTEKAKPIEWSKPKKVTRLVRS